MAQVFEHPYILESSTQLSRPDMKTFFQSDIATGGTDIDKEVKKREHSLLHVPKRTGPKDYQLQCCDPDLGPLYEKPPSLKPNVATLIDPISGFLSPSGEVLLETGKMRLETMGKSRIEPQTTIPQNINSIRDNDLAIDEIKRGSYGKDDPRLYWNSKKVLDGALRARLGGWTSDFNPLEAKKDPNIIQRGIQELFPNMKVPYSSADERERLAKKYQYTSGTQSMYEDVNWDAKLPSRIHAPYTTNEYAKADPLKNMDDLYLKPQLYQTIGGKVWDALQDRDQYFIKEKVSFVSPNKRGNQIPGYSGCLNGVNIESMNDNLERFTPFTVTRTEQPKPTHASFKPNIPGYTGQIHNYKITSVSHFDSNDQPCTTYSAYHRKLPTVEQNMPPLSSLNGDFLRIQTKVPPSNPYNQIEMKTDPYTNHSLAHVQNPIQNLKMKTFTRNMVKHQVEAPVARDSSA